MLTLQMPMRASARPCPFAREHPGPVLDEEFLVNEGARFSLRHRVRSRGHMNNRQKTGHDNQRQAKYAHWRPVSLSARPDGRRRSEAEPKGMANERPQFSIAAETTVAKLKRGLIIDAWCRCVIGVPFARLLPRRGRRAG